ncbi:MAG: glycosyltransferase family 2 protein [Geminicoccales bacterium]
MNSTVAVVAATHNRDRRLARLLGALRDQERRPDEVIVVDDGSTDGVPAVLAAEVDRGELPLRVIRRERAAGPATAREEGWRAASSDLVAFTDDDCEPQPGWLAATVATAAANPGCFVQGRVEPIPAERSSLGPFSHTIWVRGLDPAFPTCNMTYPRGLLERIGGFDVATFGREPGGEDCDLGWRAIEAGAQPVFAREALVHHAVTNLGPLGKLRLAARWTTPMTAYARHPELRRSEFTFGIFWKAVHWHLCRALLSLLLPPRWHPVRNWLAYPYLQNVWARGRVEGGGLGLAPYFILHDLVEVWAVARAALRTRTPML